MQSLFERFELEKVQIAQRLAKTITVRLIKLVDAEVGVIAKPVSGSALCQLFIDRLIIELNPLPFLLVSITWQFDQSVVVAIGNSATVEDGTDEGVAARGELNALINGHRL